MKKLISGIIISLTIIIFGLAISIMFLGASAYKSNSLFYIFDYTFSIVPTNSMIGDQPDSLDPGDVAIIRNTSFEDVEIGDVIVYQDSVIISGRTTNILIIHRVVEIQDDGSLRTKGDNPVNTIDPHPVTASTYQGSLHSKITYLKPVVDLMINSRSLIFLGLTAVLVILLIWELAHIYRNISDHKNAELKEKHEQELTKIMEKEKEKIYQEIIDEEKNKNKNQDQ
ncbi:MAG: S26 family signal peptidase [Acholeplasmataceae bacterium]|nr:S26 family signal peptidase [Acholeplasmataceae bacterium]